MKVFERKDQLGVNMVTGLIINAKEMISRCSKIDLSSVR